MTNARTGLRWKFCEVDSNILSPIKDFDSIEINKKYKLTPSKYNNFKTKNITILEKIKETKEGFEYNPVTGGGPITYTLFTYKIKDELDITTTIFCSDDNLSTSTFSFLEIPQ